MILALIVSLNAGVRYARSSVLDDMDTAGTDTNAAASTASTDSSKDSKDTKATTEVPNPKSWTGYVTADAIPCLNVRTGPWGSIVDTYKPGTKVTVVDTSGEWYIIDTGSALRYLYTKYVTRTKPSDASSSSASSGGYEKWTGYVTCASLNVRTSAWGTKVDLYSKGHQVTVIGKEGDWYKIDAGGKTLYVYAQYISKTDPGAGSQGSTGGTVSGGKGFGGSPVNGGRVSSKFGNRVHPISGQWKMHNGVDIAIGGGTPVKSLGPGKVIFAGWNGGYGNCVKIQHDNGMVTLSAHLKSYNVSVGQTVGQGTEVGKVNSTGSSTGNHLHFEIIKNGTPIDPQSVSGVTI